MESWQVSEFVRTVSVISDNGGLYGHKPISDGGCRHDELYAHVVNLVNGLNSSRVEKPHILFFYRFAHGLSKTSFTTTYFLLLYKESTNEFQFCSLYEDKTGYPSFDKFRVVSKSVDEFLGEFGGIKDNISRAEFPCHHFDSRSGALSSFRSVISSLIGFLSPKALTTQEIVLDGESVLIDFSEFTPL